MDQNQQQQIQIFKVIQYIEHHLMEDLPLKKLAEVSTYSPFHFQRIFKRIIGETPASYVKRLRLENAAHLLIYERQLSVTEIAMRCGFTSLSYFTQVFSSSFKASPREWREGTYLERFPREYEENSKKSKQVRKNEEEVDRGRSYNKFRWLELSRVQVIDLPLCQTVLRHHIGAYSNRIANVWEDLYRWSKARDLVHADTLFFGVPKNNPYITPPEKSRYECHVEVDKPNQYEGESLGEFSGGKHVVYEFEQPVSYKERGLLIETYSELYSYWLPRSGYKYLSNPVEWVTFVHNHDTLTVEAKIKAIGLAIEPK